MISEKIKKELKKDIDVRSMRYASRWWLNQNSKVNRVKNCGLCTRTSDYIPLFVNTDKESGVRSAGLRDLITCESVWLCPVCSAKNSQERATKLSRDLAVWGSKGGSTLFFTLTMRHTIFDPLKTQMDSIQSSWNSMTNNRNYKSFLKKYGIISSLRATELTHNFQNGFHTHFHGVYLINPGVDVNKEIFETELFQMWSNSLNKFGFTALRNYGVDVVKSYGDSGLASYLTKSSNAAKEVAGYGTKNARLYSRTPFAILADLTQAYSNNETQTKEYKTDLALWFQIETATKGKRQFQTGRNFNKLTEDTEELFPILEKEFDTQEVYLEAYYFNFFARANKSNVGKLLNLAEQSLFSAVDFFLQEVLKSQKKLTRPAVSYTKTKTGEYI